jgi:sulfate permease, SulP family
MPESIRIRLAWADRIVWFSTFVLTVFADLTVAVEVGMLLAALLCILRISQTTTVTVVTSEYLEESRLHVLHDKEVPPYVTILRIHGPFLFGTTEKLDEATADLNRFTSVILRLRNMTAIDATGLHALERLSARLHKSGRALLMCGAREQPAQMLHRAEFVNHVGEENILPNVSSALERAREINERFGGLAMEVAQHVRTEPL